MYCYSVGECYIYNSCVCSVFSVMSGKLVYVTKESRKGVGICLWVCLFIGCWPQKEERDYKRRGWS